MPSFFYRFVRPAPGLQFAGHFAFCLADLAPRFGQALDPKNNISIFTVIIYFCFLCIIFSLRKQSQKLKEAEKGGGSLLGPSVLHRIPSQKTVSKI